VGALVGIPVLFAGAAASHAAPLAASLATPGSFSISGSSTCGGQTWVGNLTPEFSASAASENPASSNLDLIFRVEQGGIVVAESPLVPATPGAVASWELPPASALADNQAYSFEVRASQGAENSAWSAPYPFTEETSAATAPAVQSFDYPPSYWGAPAGQPGTFRFVAAVGGGVTPDYGFVWALDSGGTLPSVGCQSAFDDGGYGLLTPTTGTATLRLPVGLPVGSHDLYVAALSAAGLLSPVTSYQFFVSRDDSVVAQPEQYLLEGHRLAAAGSLTQPSGQNACTFTGGTHAIWADGHQEHLVATGPAQSFTFEFKAPVTASYALGVHLTDGADYGELAFSLVDLTTGTTQPLLAIGGSGPYDAYNPTLTTSYVELGGASLKSGDSYGIGVTVTGKKARTSSRGFASLCPVDTNPTDNGSSAGIDYFTVVAINDVTFPSLRAALNNRGLVLDATGRVLAKDQSMDLAGDNLSESLLQAAGFGFGDRVTVGAGQPYQATFTMPYSANRGGVFEDDIISGGQTINLSGTQPTQNLSLLVVATCGPTPSLQSDAFTLEYPGGLFTDPMVPPLPDWLSGAAGSSNGYARVTKVAQLAYFDRGLTPNSSAQPSLRHHHPQPGSGGADHGRDPPGLRDYSHGFLSRRAPRGGHQYQLLTRLPAGGIRRPGTPREKVEVVPSFHDRSAG
jgi:hypothetical protein